MLQRTLHIHIDTQTDIYTQRQRYNTIHTDRQTDTLSRRRPESTGKMLKMILQLLSLTAIKQLLPLLQHYFALDSLGHMRTHSCTHNYETVLT